jgi:hypothetical protein
MLTTILLIAGLVCFILDAFGAIVPRVKLTPLGLAFWILATLL